MALYTRAVSVNLGPSMTGLAGTLGRTIRSAAGSVLVARSTSGITEIGPGIYRASTANFDTEWTGFIEWDDGTSILAVDDFQSIPLGADLKLIQGLSGMNQVLKNPQFVGGNPANDVAEYDVLIYDNAADTAGDTGNNVIKTLHVEVSYSGGGWVKQIAHET